MLLLQHTEVHLATRGSQQPSEPKYEDLARLCCAAVSVAEKRACFGALRDGLTWDAHWDRDLLHN